MAKFNFTGKKIEILKGDGWNGNIDFIASPIKLYEGYYSYLFGTGAIQDYRVVIDGVEYTQEHIKDTIDLRQNLLDKSTFTVGSFTIGVLKLKLKVPSEDIPHNASVVFSYRYNNGELQSEWVEKFKGKITKRTELTEEVTVIEVKDKASNYDRFLDYFGDSISKYPANTRVVAKLCAEHLGLKIENIEDIVDLDIVEYPNELTMVEMLKNIARNSGGNWIIVGDKLRLVTIGTNKKGIDYPAQSLETSSLLSPISKVVMYYDDESAFESGDGKGSTLEIDSKWATQESADYVHSVLNRYEYVPVKTTGVYIDPAVELGDIVSIDGHNVLVANVKWSFDGIITADIEVPLNNEENYDDPYNKLVQNQFKRKVSLGDSYQGVTISRDKGIEMLVSPDGTEENAIGRYYADLYRGIAFQSRDNKNQEWHDWMYFDLQEKTFKMHIIEEIQEDIENIEKVTTQNSAGIEGLSDTVKIHGQKITTTEKGIKDLDGNLTNLSKTVTEETGRLDVAYDRIEANVQSINAGENIIPNLNGTTETYRGWEWANSSLYNHPRLVQRDGLRANTNFLITELTDSLSRWGLEFYTNGSAISPVGYVVPNSEYSFKGKRAKGSQAYKVIVREYRGSTLNKSTTFSIGSTPYGEFTLKPQATSDSVRLEFVITGVSQSNPLILTEMMFNRGIPNRYKDTPEDVKFWASTQVEQLDDKFGVTTKKVDNLSNDIHNTTVDITPERGVEIWSTAGNGLTVYDQNNSPSVELTTDGKIKAIDAEFINALITGNLVAGKISGLVFDNNTISFPDGKLELDSAKNAITFGRMEMKHSTRSTPGGTTDVITIKTPTGKMEFLSGINYAGGKIPNTFEADAISTDAISGKVGGDGVLIGGVEGSAPTHFTHSIINLFGGFDIGSSSKRWSSIFLKNQPNVSSDPRQKKLIEDIPQELLERLASIPAKKYIQNGQVHFGYIATDVERELYKYCVDKYGWENASLAMERYALLYKDESYLSLLYGEITIIKDAYYKRKIEQLECDIIELKKKPKVSRGFRKRSGK